VIVLLGIIPGRHYNYREILPGVIAPKSSAPRFQPKSLTGALHHRTAGGGLSSHEQGDTDLVVKQRIFDYKEDDCVAMRVLLDAMRAMAVRPD